MIASGEAQESDQERMSSAFVCYLCSKVADQTKRDSTVVIFRCIISTFCFWGWSFTGFLNRPRATTEGAAVGLPPIKAASAVGACALAATRGSCSVCVCVCVWVCVLLRAPSARLGQAWGNIMGGQNVEKKPANVQKAIQIFQLKRIRAAVLGLPFDWWIPPFNYPIYLPAALI